MLPPLPSLEWLDPWPPEPDEFMNMALLMYELVRDSLDRRFFELAAAAEILLLTTYSQKEDIT
jgi:hypothetical protein